MQVLKEADMQKKEENEEVASLIRVRNRLAAARDDKLPRILAGLLPRLLRKIDDETQCILQSSNANSVQQETQFHLTGILSHAYDRIRDVEASRETPWILPVTKTLPFLKTNVAKTMAVSFLETGICYVEDHDTIPFLVAFLARQTRLAVYESDDAPASDQKILQKAGWLLINTIAVLSGLPVRKQDMLTDPPWPNLETIPSFPECSSTDGDDGLLDTLLDLVLFSPVIQTRFGLGAADSSTGLSHQGLARMNIKRNLFLENEIYLQQLKLACTTAALGSVELAGLLEGNKAVLFAVVVSSNNSRHGRYALAWLDAYLHRKENNQSRNGSLPLSCSLVALILSDRDASTTAYGKHQELFTPQVIRRLPTNAAHYRTPLPEAVARRVANFLDAHFTISPRQVLASTDYVNALLELVAASVHSARCSSDHLATTIMRRIYFSARSGPAQSVCPERHYGNDVATVTVYRKCLEVAKETLMKLLDANHCDERYFRPDQQEDIPVGAIRPLGQCEGVNTLIAEHRRRQRKKKLACTVSLDARRNAYTLIEELADPRFLGEESTGSIAFTFPGILLECLTAEEYCLLENASQALTAFSSTYEAMIERHKSNCTVKQFQISKLLPAVLSAVCTDSRSARLAAAHWTVRFIAECDPGAALCICEFLAGDDDSKVRFTARNLLDKGLSHKIERQEESAYFFDLSLSSDFSCLCQIMDKTIQKLCEEGSMRTWLAIRLLHENEFDVERALEVYADGVSQVNPPKDLGASRISSAKLSGTNSCNICYEDCSELFHKGCGHCFCLSCWKMYITSCFEKLNGCILASCPHHDCDITFNRRDLQFLFPESVAQWDRSCLASFLDRSNCFVRCTGRNCSMVVYNQQRRRLPVVCTKCRSIFCSLCGDAAHEPCQCSSWKNWYSIYGSSSFWMKQYTKPCPSCHVPVEKDHGCNHISCSRCGAEYCWLCLSLLRSHMEAHTCNRFNPLSVAEDENEARALFYTDRYQNHEESEHYAEKKLEQFKRKTAEISKKVWFRAQGEIDILETTCHQLVILRNFLKLSYVEAWALGDDTAKQETLENQQAVLELVTERASLLLHQNIDEVYRNAGLQGVNQHFRKLTFLVSCADHYRKRICTLCGPTTVR